MEEAARHYSALVFSARYRDLYHVQLDFTSLSMPDVDGENGPAVIGITGSSPANSTLR